MGEGPEVKVLYGSTLSRTAIAMVKRFDIVISGVDNASARAGASALAWAYLRPRLDIASGVFLGAGPDEHERLTQEEIE